MNMNDRTIDMNVNDRPTKYFVVKPIRQPMMDATMAIVAISNVENFNVGKSKKFEENYPSVLTIFDNDDKRNLSVEQNYAFHLETNETRQRSMWNNRRIHDRTELVRERTFDYLSSVSIGLIYRCPI
jgi:hypothetical protein